MKKIKDKLISNKNNLKKIVAVLCAITLLPWGTFVTQKTLDVQASEETTTVTNPDVLEKWTIADVGLANGNYTYAAESIGQSGTATGTTMDQKKFVSNIIFPELTQNDAYFCVGGEYLNDAINGLTFLVIPGAVYLRHYSSAGMVEFGKIDASKFGLTSLIGQSLKLTLTAEFANNNGTTTDAKIGFYINDILYNDSYLELTNVPVNSLQQQVSTYTRWSGGKSFWLGTPVTPIDKFEQWDITDVGLNSGDYTYTSDSTGMNGTPTGASMDQKAFVTKVTFPTIASNDAYFLIGGQYLNDTLSGLTFRVQPTGVSLMHYSSAGTTNFGTIDPSKFGLDTLIEKKLKLTLTVEFENNSGTTTDAKIGFYINDILYNNQYLELTNVPVDSLQLQVSTFTRWSGGKSFKLEKPVTNPSDLEVWDINTVNISKKNANASAGAIGTATGKKQIGTAFRTKVTYPSNLPADGYADMWIGGNNDGYLLRAYPSVGGDGNLLLYLRDATGYPMSQTYSNNYIILKPSDFNMTTSLLGQELEVILTSELVQGTGGYATAYVGLYINGNLYQNDYIVIPQVMGTGVSQNVVLSTSTSTASIYVDVCPTKPEELEEWSIDTAGLIDGAYTGGISGVETGKSQDKTAFAAKVVFPTGIDSSHEATLFVGGFGVGYAFKVQNETLVLQFWGDGVSNMATLTAEGANVEGLTSLLGTELDITLTTEFVNKGETTTDAYVGLYINGVLYGGDYFRLTGRPISAFPMGVYIHNSSAGDKTTWLSATRVTHQIADSGVSYQVLGAAGYTLPASGDIVVNSVQKANGSKITAIGDYRVVQTRGNFVTTETVVLWKTGAVNSDGDVNVKDLIALKKLESVQEPVLSRAAKKGADVDASGAINSNDTSALRDYLVGKQ